MTNYFVRSHVNNRIYISHDKLEMITEECKECGKKDTVLFSFDDKDINEPEKSIKEYMTRELIVDRKELIKKIDSYNVGNINPYAAVTEVRCNAVCSVADNKDLLDDMLYCQCIDKKAYDEIIKYIDCKYKKYDELIKFLNYGMIIFDREQAKIKVKEK